ncbi:MAG: hypothetical protein IE933_05140 [Sphingomonadales bacterium]|nr:hypothetical protein [Sphingomonadales bacterium]MBD3773092.1 hypothetical protein [Paracoccaceae bacterium]
MHNSGSESHAPDRLLVEAIARRRLVTAQYNGATLELAPHRLFTRHGELHLSAFNPNKNWRSEEERKLGHFKLAGLGDIAISEQDFEPLPDFGPELPREGDVEIFSVQPLAA